MYPERPSEVDIDLSSLREVGIDPKDLDPRVIAIDNELSELLSEAKGDHIDSLNLFGIEYFDTEEGRVLLQSIIDETETVISSDVQDDVVSVLDRIDWSKLKGGSKDVRDRRDKIIVEVNNHTRDRLFKDLKRVLIDEEEGYSIDDIVVPTKYDAVLDEDAVISRLTNLRLLKARLKRDESLYIGNPQLTSLYRAYREKVNLLIVNTIFDVVKIYDRNERLGDASGRYLPYIQSFKKSRARERNLSKFDLYRNGKGEIQDHRYTPFGSKLLSLVGGLKNENDVYPDLKKFETEYGENFIVTPEFVKDLFVVLLESNQFQGWKVVIKEKAKTMSIETITEHGIVTRKTITIPKNLKRDFYTTHPSYLLAIVEHEFTHVLRAETRIMLDDSSGLFRDAGPITARSNVSIEGAAVRREKITQGKLGLKRPMSYQYFDAIERRLQGGNYIDCVIAFYYSYLRQHGDTDKGKALKSSIGGTKRIFGNLGNTKSKEGYLSRSDPLAYLEEDIVSLVDKYGLITPYVFYLVQSGLVDLKKIIEIEDTFLGVGDVITPDTVRKLREKHGI